MSNRNTIPTPYIGLGKLPPQATDLEEAVLGQFIEGIQISPAAWAQLKSEIFYKDNHQRIAKAILQLKSDGHPVDELTVVARLRKMGELEMVGGAYYIMELTRKPSKLQSLSYHISIIHEKFLQRELIRLNTESINEAYEDTSNPFETIGKIINGITALKNGIFKRKGKTMSELLDEATAEMNKPKVDGLLGISTGIDALDKLIKGYQNSQLIYDAGRPGMGKTAKMCSQIKHIAIEQKKKVAAFSLEMKGVSLTYRMWANVSEVETDKIKENRLLQFERDKLEVAKQQLRDSGIIINDTPGLDILTFETEGALLVSQGVQIIFIDYVQLMMGDPTKNYRGNRELELSDISKRLKKCANEWDIPIVVLSSLARAVEDRKNCIPILRDLRESGSLEQDADVVIGSWRPEYYEDIIKDLPGVHFENFDLTITGLHGLLVNIVLKCREGKTGKAPSLFVGKYMRVVNHPDLVNKIEQEKNGTLLTPEERPVLF